MAYTHAHAHAPFCPCVHPGAHTRLLAQFLLDLLFQRSVRHMCCSLPAGGCCPLHHDASAEPAHGAGRSGPGISGLNQSRWQAFQVSHHQASSGGCVHCAKAEMNTSPAWAQLVYRNALRVLCCVGSALHQVTSPNPKL